MEVPEPRVRLRFGPFVLDTRRAELARDGIPVPLRPKPFALLATLAASPGTVLSKEQLLAAVWPGVVVTDDSLTQAVHDLREALGQPGQGWIRTVARRGYRFDAVVVDADAPPHDAAVTAAAPRPSRLRQLAVAGLVAGLVGAVVGGWRLVDYARLQTQDGAVETGGPQAPRLSLVVLPFDVEAGSEGSGWFGDALSADLTTELGKFSGMFVISRDTAFTYKGRPADPRAVARELNVRYVVHGVVRRKQNDVRLDLALVDGETGRQHWAERFDLDRAHLLKSLQEATGIVSRTLGVEVYRAEGLRAATLGPDQIEADDLAMRGWALWYRGLSRENVLQALALFEDAVARDPESLRGWAGISVATGTAVSSGWAADPAAAAARGREALRQLERIDPNDQFTAMARSGAYFRTQDFAGLLTLAGTLVERFPSNPFGHHTQGWALVLLGRFDECVEPIRKAIRLGPRDTFLPYSRSALAFCHFFAGRYAEAVDEAHRAVQANSALAGPHLILAAALARSGQVDEARRVVRENAGRPPFNLHTLRLVLLGNAPRLVAGREQMFETLEDLGVRQTGGPPSAASRPS